MADEIDIANDYAQKMEERNVAAIRAAAAVRFGIDLNYE